MPLIHAAPLRGFLLLEQLRLDLGGDLLGRRRRRAGSLCTGPVGSMTNQPNCGVLKTWSSFVPAEKSDLVERGTAWPLLNVALPQFGLERDVLAVLLDERAPLLGGRTLELVVERLRERLLVLPDEDDSGTCGASTGLVLGAVREVVLQDRQAADLVGLPELVRDRLLDEPLLDRVAAERGQRPPQLLERGEELLVVAAELLLDHFCTRASIALSVTLTPSF